MDSISQTAFTNKEIYCALDKQIWYEYCPSNEHEFKQMLEPLLFAKQNSSDGLVREAVNAFLMQEFIDVDALTKHSSVAQWLNVYWALYLQGEITIGYMKEGRMGLRIFFFTSKPVQNYIM